MSIEKPLIIFTDYFSIYHLVHNNIVCYLHNVAILQFNQFQIDSIWLLDFGMDSKSFRLSCISINKEHEHFAGITSTSEKIMIALNNWFDDDDDFVTPFNYGLSKKAM